MTSRQYPTRPILGVGAVVLTDDGEVILVRRAHPPRAGEWSLPGGGVELGETVAEAVGREVREETGLDVAVGPLVEIIDRILRDSDGRIEYHFVLLDYVCRVTGGRLEAGSDAAEVVPVPLHGLVAMNLRDDAVRVIRKGAERLPEIRLNRT